MQLAAGQFLPAFCPTSDMSICESLRPDTWLFEPMFCREEGSSQEDSSVWS